MSVTWCFTLRSSQAGGERLHSADPSRAPPAAWSPRDAAAYATLSHTPSPSTLVKTRFNVNSSCSHGNGSAKALPFREFMHESDPRASDCKWHAFPSFTHSLTCSTHIYWTIIGSRCRTCDGKRSSCRTDSSPNRTRAVTHSFVCLNLGPVVGDTEVPTCSDARCPAFANGRSNPLIRRITED